MGYTDYKMSEKASPKVLLNISHAKKTDYNNAFNFSTNSPLKILIGYVSIYENFSSPI